MDSTTLELLLLLGGAIAGVVWGYVGLAVRDRMKAGMAKDALLELMALAELVVRDIAQRVKPALIEAAKDGQLSELDRVELKELAVKSVTGQMSTIAQKVLTAGGVPLEHVVGRAVEAAVLKTKAGP